MNKEYEIWQAKMKNAMSLLKEGCQEIPKGVSCFECPFNYVCDCLLQARDCGFYIDVPSTWEIKE